VHFRFGDCELREDTMELLRGGAKVAIQPKVLQLLLVLLRHRARALTRTELFELVWADVRVGQDSLTRAIVQARRAIGDDRQEMIATVRGHGFRFAATVLEIPAGGSAAPAMPAGLIGREASLSALAAQLSQAHGGRGAIAWVSGVPGIGKTRLLEELAILARASAATVHFLRCHETPAQPPFWPWSSLVEELAQDASGARGRELRDAGAALEAPNAGLRAFDAVTRAIVGARGAGPLVVIVDDLQWADEGSLELLRFFVREIRDARVLVVGAYRDNAPSARALGAILQEYGSVSVPLRGLSREETARLVQARAGQEPSTSFATAIHERTGGSPLFIEQLLATEWATRALHDESRAAATSLDLERGLLEAFARHLDGLTSSCKDVLSWAALLGKEFDFAVLSAASGVEGNELLDHLDRAASARVVHRTAGRHAFVHPLIADVLYKSLTASERASRHRIVGQALEQLHAGALDLQAEAIAHHFFKAAPTGTARAAFEYSVRASRNAGRMGDAKRAVGLLQQALRALDLIADAHLERLDVQLELARALMSAGLADRACDALFDTVMLGRAVGQPSVASLALAELEKLAPGDPRIALARQEQV
jgi:predicted ATPase